MKEKKFTLKISFLLLFMLASFGMSSQLQAQQKVTGTIFTQEDGLPLIGATIQEKGTTNGTATDVDGTFSLTVASPDAILLISYIGYTTQEIASSSTPLSISLVEDSNTLDVVTVVGYGTQKKSDIVNAVATTDLDDAINADFRCK